MQYLALPGIDQPVSTLGLGTATRIFTPGTYDKAAELLDAFLAAGGNCIDGAHIYGFGNSEKTLGRWLHERGTRDRVVLISKGCHPIVDLQNPFSKPWEPRVTPEAIHADLMESLERLQTDSVDLYLLHRDDEQVPVGPLVQALNAEQSSGRIRAFGASNWTSERVIQANTYAAEHGLNGFVISSVQFSLLRPTSLYFPGTLSASADDLAWHAKTRFPLMAWSTLSAGYLHREAQPDSQVDDPVADTFKSPTNSAVLQRARELAARKGITIVQLALAYVLQQPFPITALAGPTSTEHLHTLIGALSVQLDNSEMAYLRPD